MSRVYTCRHTVNYSGLCDNLTKPQLSKCFIQNPSSGDHNIYSRTSVIRAGSSIRLIRNTFLSGTHALTKESACVAESAFSFSCM